MPAPCSASPLAMATGPYHFSLHQVLGTMTCGTPCSTAAAKVPAPPWCTSAEHVGSSALSGTKPTVRTLSGNVGMSATCSADSVAITSTSNDATALMSAAADASTRPASRWELPSVTHTRGLVG